MVSPRTHRLPVRGCALGGAVLTALVLAAPGSAGQASGKASAHRLLISDARVAAARRYARGRAGDVSFAVLDADGRLRGHRRTRTHPSASASKAMLLVAVLRRQGHRALTAEQRSLLAPMIRWSDNAAADRIYAQVGGGGLRAVARAAGMHRFRDVGYWSDAVLTAADQVRLFRRIDRLVPHRHRHYLRRLLRTVIGPQRWGIAAVADHRGWRIMFKGGWRAGLANQSVLIEHGGRRAAVSVLTSSSPSMEYGIATIRGIAQRLIGR